MLETRLRRAGGVGDRDEPNRCIANALHLHSTIQRGSTVAGSAQASASPPRPNATWPNVTMSMQRRGVENAGRASSACGCPPKNSLIPALRSLVLNCAPRRVPDTRRRLQVSGFRDHATNKKHEHPSNDITHASLCVRGQGSRDSRGTRVEGPRRTGRQGSRDHRPHRVEGPGSR